MPKIPISFDTGAYQDVNERLGGRILYNCHVETSPGAVNKEIIRSTEGVSQLINDVNGTFNTAIIVDSVLYYVAGGNFYSAPMPNGPSTNEGALPAIFGNTQAKLASNGKNVVILAPSGLNTEDYYFDIVGGTLATIVSKDADWTSFGKALDVAFKDGYYVFITENNIFHGDNSATADGLGFDPLSFDALPAASGAGVGLEVANSQLYAMTKRKTFLYQTAGTTPFSFARSVGLDLDIGLAAFSSKVSFEDQIIMIGNVAGGTLRTYLITGTSYRTLSNDYIEEKLKLYSDPKKMQVSSYEIRGHRFVHITQNVAAQGASTALVLDLTETTLRGVGMWHERALTSSGTILSNFYPIQQYLDATDATFGYVTVYAMGVRDAFRGATLYKIEEEETLGNAAVFDTTASQTFKQFTFQFIRSSGDPVNLNKIRLRFTDNVTTAELFYSTDGITYTTLGSFDLTNVDSKTAEWRRIGRFNNDVSFRVRFEADYVLNDSNPQLGNKAVSVIEGYLEV